MAAKIPNDGLPVGWYRADAKEAARLFAELQSELPLEVWAHRDGATDDILVRHSENKQRFTVVHLSWLGKTEINAKHPTVEFDGSFEDFVKEEERIWDLKPPAA